MPPRPVAGIALLFLPLIKKLSFIPVAGASKLLYPDPIIELYPEPAQCKIPFFVILVFS
jgi:hypothetical protein